MRQLSIFGLARDMGASNVIEPTLAALRERGHRVYLGLEQGGAAFDKPHTVYSRTASNAGDLRAILREAKPDIVISGLSSPRHLENDLDMMARDGGIRLVHIEDWWAAIYAPQS